MNNLKINKFQRTHEINKTQLNTIKQYISDYYKN